MICARVARGSWSWEAGKTNLIARFAKDASGVAVMEYGLLVALIAVVIIVYVTAVGGYMSYQFSQSPTG